jgi:DNA replication protein DnaC
VQKLTPELKARFAAAKIKHFKRKIRQTEKVKGNFADCLPAGITENLKKRDLKPVLHNDFYETDENGCLWVSEKDLKKMQDEEAFKRHGNDPDVRLDECGFPKNRKDRKFLLQHDFGDQLQEILKEIRRHKWIYGYGNAGRGKTALMTRAVWEILKVNLRIKASFISMNRYIRDQIKLNSLIQAALHRGEEVDFNFGDKKLRGLVLLDDFDKVNFRNEFNVRGILDLIERLKDMNAWVLITAQYSINKLFNKYQDNEDMLPLCDRLRERCHVLPEFKGKSFR